MLTGIPLNELRKQSNSITYEKTNAFIVVFDFIVLWYYFFSGTLSLRPMASIFWVVSAVIGLFLFRVKLLELNTYNSLCLIGVVSIFLSILSSVVDTASMKYALSMILYLIIAYQLTSSMGNIHVLLKLMMLFSVFLVVITYIQAHMPVVYNKYILPVMPVHFHERILTFMRNKAHPGLYNQTSENALTMSLGCFLSMKLLTKGIESKNSTKKIIGIILVLAFLYGVILTNRRGSTISVGLILFIYCYIKIKSPTFRVLLIIGIGVFIASGAWMNVSVLENLINKTEQYAAEGNITNGRLEIWSESLKLFWYGPIFGYGADSYAYVSTQGYAHNSYLQSLVELGLIGAILFYLPFLYGFVFTIRLYKKRKCYSVEQISVIEFCLCWQAYCFMNAFVESFFSSEISVFMFYITQMMCLQIEKTALNTIRK